MSPETVDILRQVVAIVNATGAPAIAVVNTFVEDGPTKDLILDVLATSMAVANTPAAIRLGQRAVTALRGNPTEQAPAQSSMDARAHAILQEAGPEALEQVIASLGAAARKT